MIEKKIRYDINIEKPSKTKPVTQGGVLNYLGKQKTVTAPRRWRSSPDHPIAHLAYITKDEEKILIDLNLYGSLKGKPNKGPSGIMSLQGSGGGAGGGDGGGDGGDSGGSSDSDSGTGQSGAQSGDNSDGNNADGTSGGPGTDGMGGPGGFGGDVGAEGGFGIGPGDDGPGLGQSDTFGSDVGPGLGIGENLGQADTFASDVNEDETTQQGFSFAPVTSLIESAIKGYMNFSPTGLAIKGITGLVDSVTKGKTGPSDDTQETFSVQVGPSPTNDPGGGITTIPTYAPLTNVSTGDNTTDAIRTRLENLLKPSGGTGYQSNSTYQNFLQSPFYDPKVAGSQVITPVTLPSGQILNLPNAATANQFNQYLSSLSSLPNQSVNSLSGYTLADLIRLRGR